METSLCYYILVFIIFLFFKKYSQTLDRRLPPSPSLSFPLVGHLHLFKKPLHRTLAKLANQHGPILYIKFGSRPVVIVSSPSSAEKCFTRNDIAFANRPGLLAGKHLGYNYTTLAWASYGPHWRNFLRIASLEILSSHRLQMFHCIRTDEVRSFISRLVRGSSGGEFQVVDMKSSFFELTLNVIMRMIAGKRYSGEDPAAKSNEANRFEQIVRQTFQLSGATNIGDFVPILKYIGENELEKSC